MSRLHGWELRGCRYENLFEVLRKRCVVVNATRLVGGHIIAGLSMDFSVLISNSSDLCQTKAL